MSTERESRLSGQEYGTQHAVFQFQKNDLDIPYGKPQRGRTKFEKIDRLFKFE